MSSSLIHIYVGALVGVTCGAAFVILRELWRRRRRTCSRCRWWATRNGISGRCLPASGRLSWTLPSQRITLARYPHVAGEDDCEYFKEPL